MRSRTYAHRWLEAYSGGLRGLSKPRSGSLILAIALTIQGVVSVSPAFADASSILLSDVYYSTSCPANGASADIRRTTFRLEGNQLSVDPPASVGTVASAGPLLFAGNGDLIVYGSDGTVDSSPASGAVATAVANGPAPTQLAIDSSGTNVWATTSGGSLLELSPTGGTPPNAVQASGDDNNVLSLTFGDSGTVYYLGTADDGASDIGAIDLTTLTTTRLLGGVPAGQHLQFDPFSHSLMVFGDNRITQISVSPMNVTGVKQLSSDGAYNQGTVDGLGHALVVDSTSGNVEVLDYAAAGLIGEATPLGPAFLDGCVAGVAPLAGPGAATFYTIAGGDAKALTAGGFGASLAAPGGSPLALGSTTGNGVVAESNSAGGGSGGGGGSRGGGGGGGGGGSGSRGGTDGGHSILSGTPHIILLGGRGSTPLGVSVNNPVTTSNFTSNTEPAHPVVDQIAEPPQQNQVNASSFVSLNRAARLSDQPGPGPDPSATPELDSLALLATGGFGLLGYVTMRRRRKSRD
jgi:hypothetical protein